MPHSYSTLLLMSLHSPPRLESLSVVPAMLAIYTVETVPRLGPPERLARRTLGELQSCSIPSSPVSRLTIGHDRQSSAIYGHCGSRSWKAGFKFRQLPLVSRILIPRNILPRPLPMREPPILRARKSLALPGSANGREEIPRSSTQSP